MITLNPLKIFQVVAGKFFRDFDNVEDQVTQTFNVIKISSPGFKGTAGLNEADIASLVLDDFIVYQPHISPICIDLNIEFSSQYELAPHTRGFIGGWGNTGGNQTPSDILRSIEMPVVAHQTCKNEAIAEFEPFIIAGKIFLVKRL